MRIRFADHFGMMDFYSPGHEGCRCKGQRHAVVVIGVDLRNATSVKRLQRWGLGHILQCAESGGGEVHSELLEFLGEGGDAVGLFDVERGESRETEGASEEGASDDKCLRQIGSGRKIALIKCGNGGVLFRQAGTFACEFGLQAERRKEIDTSRVTLYAFCVQSAEQHAGFRIGRKCTSSYQ